MNRLGFVGLAGILFWISSCRHRNAAMSFSGFDAAASQALEGDWELVVSTSCRHSGSFNPVRFAKEIRVSIIEGQLIVNGEAAGRVELIVAKPLDPSMKIDFGRGYVELQQSDDATKTLVLVYRSSTGDVACSGQYGCE